MYRVGINLLCYPTERLTGTGRFLKNLLEALPETAHDVEWTFYCQKNFPLEVAFDLPKGIRYRRLDCPSFRSHLHRVLYEQTVLPFRARGLDVLYSPCGSNPVVHPGFRTISTIHDLTPFVVSDKYGAIQQSYVKVISRALAATSDHIITVSENSRRDLMQWFGIDDRKISIVYNIARPKQSVGVTYGNYFLCVGALQPAKNIEGVLRAFSIFRRKYDKDGHKLYLVGGLGWGQDVYRDLVRGLNLESDVVLTGYVSDRELDALYAGCKGVVMLSFYEGFGIPPLEALCWNKPSVVSNVSSLPEVVGETGILVDPRDSEQAAAALGRIADEPEKYLRGRDEQLKKFSRETQVRGFLTALGVM